MLVHTTQTRNGRVTERWFKIECIIIIIHMNYLWINPKRALSLHQSYLNKACLSADYLHGEVTQPCDSCLTDTSNKQVASQNKSLCVSMNAQRTPEKYNPRSQFRRWKHDMYCYWLLRTEQRRNRLITELWSVLFSYRSVINVACSHSWNTN